MLIILRITCEVHFHHYWHLSKASDTARHASLLHNMAHIRIPDTVHNWLVSLSVGLPDQ